MSVKNHFLCEEWYRVRCKGNPHSLGRMWKLMEGVVVVRPIGNSRFWSVERILGMFKREKRDFDLESQRFILVTSVVHLLRSMMLFTNEGDWRTE